jgi:lysozyme
MAVGEMVIREIKRDESFRAKPYKDTVGKLTIGYGRNLDDVGISKREALELLRYDVFVANRELLSFPWYDSLTSCRKRALLNMMYNLGFTRFNKFKKMIKAFKIGDYNLAADEALDSKWAKQVGSRADRIAELIRQG